MKILVTGSSGFIGFHTCVRLLKKDHTIIGVDNENDAYDVSLKHARRKILEKNKRFSFLRLDLADTPKLPECSVVIHLAARAGVQDSAIYPQQFFNSNLVGFMNVLNHAKKQRAKFIYASSSSVYGREANGVNIKSDTSHPISFYAATKKCNEVIAHSYSEVYGMSVFGIRFFTVFGPYGRPDMSMFKFAKAISKGKTVTLYNWGENKRAFTYIDDAVDVIEYCLESKKRGHNIFTTAGSILITMESVAKEIAKVMHKRLHLLKTSNTRTGDISCAWADSRTNPVANLKSNNKKNIRKFVNWFKNYYHV